jgi:hypothetical protein
MARRIENAKDAKRPRYFYPQMSQMIADEDRQERQWGWGMRRGWWEWGVGGRLVVFVVVDAFGSVTKE